MTLAALFVLADKPAKVGSGAVLTLVLPLGVTLVALAIWWYAAKRAGMAPETSEFSEPETEPRPGPAPE